MKFKCGPCDTMWVANEAAACVKGEFNTLAHKVFQIIPNAKWRASCALCGQTWGPFNNLDDLEDAMKRDGVLK